MDTADPPKPRSRPRSPVVSIILPFVGVALPLCLLTGGYPFVEHGRLMSDQELVLALLCSLLFLVLEVFALAYGLAARRTVLCKVAIGLSGLLLVPSSLLVAYGFTIYLDRDGAGMLARTRFGVIMAAVLLAMALLLGLLRAKWPNEPAHHGNPSRSLPG